MSVMRPVLMLGFLLIVWAGAARADEAAPAACTVTNSTILSQDQGDVTITCTRLSDVVGQQFADILTRILQDRLDPQMVMAKLSEVDQIPEAGVARVVDESQRQLIIKALTGKPPGLVAINAHPEEGDAADFAKSIATPLLQAGWQIEGQQIRRAAPASLDPIHGLAVVVHDKATPPAPAVQLKAALNAAHISAALVADQSLAAGTTLLWVGRRPGSAAPEPPK